MLLLLCLEAFPATDGFVLEMLPVVFIELFLNGQIQLPKAVKFCVSQRGIYPAVNGSDYLLHPGLVAGFVAAGRQNSGLIMIGKVAERGAELGLIAI